MALQLSTNTRATAWSKFAQAPLYAIGAHDPNSPYGPLGVAYLHDFATGFFTLSWVLDPPTYQVQSVGALSQRATSFTKINAKPFQPQNDEGILSVLLDETGVGNLSAFQFNMLSYKGDSLEFTRSNIDPSLVFNPGNNCGTIQGPYSMNITTPGTRNFNMVLYWTDVKLNLANFLNNQGTVGPNNNYIDYETGLFSPTNTGAGTDHYTGNQGYYGANWQAFSTPLGLMIPGAYLDVAQFQVIVYQKAVGVVKNTNTAGAVIPTNTTITGMDTVINKTITLFNGDSRKHNTGTNTWAVWKQNNVGAWVTATPGVDATITYPGGTGPNDPTIQVTWLQQGNYRITSETGFSYFSPVYNTTYNDSDTVQINIPVVGSITENITFPQVTAVLTPQNVYTNTILGTSPITAITILKVDCSATLDLSSASYTQQIDSNPLTTIVLNDTQWKTEMVNRCDVVCQLKRTGTNQVLSTLPGFGPHSFNVGPGNYDIGYVIAPKGSINVTFPVLQAGGGGGNVITGNQ